MEKFRRQPSPASWPLRQHGDLNRHGTLEVGVSTMVWRAPLMVLLAVAPLARAAEEERRTFAVRVDNKPVGAHQLVIQSRDDGTVTVNSQADVTVRFALITYKYVFRGTEIWKEGKIQQLTTSTNDNG